MSQDQRSEQYQKALDQFVLSWGEMATAWGINRTMAQIHALLYAESNPLDTDAIMEQLGVSRGNANMNLRSLLDWGLVHKVHYKGSRKDYYTAEKDVWSIVSTIIKERQQREISPITDNLDECLEIFKAEQAQTEDEKEFRRRIENFKEFVEMFERFIAAMVPYINKKNLKYLKTLVKLAETKKLMSLNQFGSRSKSDGDNDGG